MNTIRIAQLLLVLILTTPANASDRPTKSWLAADAREKAAIAANPPHVPVKPDPHRSLPYTLRNPDGPRGLIAMRQFDKDGYHCDWYRVNGRGMVYSPDGAFLRHIKGKCKHCKGGTTLITSDTPARQPYVSPFPSCANGRCR